MLPLLQGVAAVARGDIRGEAARPIREALEQMARAEDRTTLARALQRILEGERDLERLSSGLDEAGRQALALVLAALSSAS